MPDDSVQTKATITPARLAGVLSRLGSSNTGEAASAANLASRMQQAIGLSWVEILTDGLPKPNVPAAPEVIRAENDAVYVSPLQTWAATAAYLSSVSAGRTQAENLFLDELAGMFSERPSRRISEHSARRLCDIHAAWTQRAPIG